MTRASQRRFILASALGAALLSSGAMAQSADDDISKGLQAEAARAQSSKIELLSAGPHDRNLGQDDGPSFQFTAENSAQEVSLNWSLVSSSSAVVPGTAVFKTGFDQVTATVTTELGDGEDSAALFGLEGFASGTSIALKWTHFAPQIKTDAPSADAAYAMAVTTCRADDANRGLDKAALEKECSSANLGEGFFVKKYNPAGFRQVMGEFFSPITPFYGFSGEINLDEYKVLNAAAFATDRVNRTGYLAKAFYGVIFRDTPTSATAAISHGRSYTSPDKATLCRPVGAGPQSECITGPNGGPERSTETIASLELRHAFWLDEGRRPRAAIAPKFSYDFRSNDYSIDVPVYLARNEKKELTGGLRFGFARVGDAMGGHDKDFSAGIFIGKAF